MRRPRDLALQTGLYAAAAISGVAAAYILKEYVLHFWDSWTRDRSVRNDASDNAVDHDRDRDSGGDSESKYESRINPTSPARLEGPSPTTNSPTSSQSLLSGSRPNNNDTTASVSPIPPSEPAVVVPRGELETRPSVHAAPAPSQTRTLPPLRTHALPPPPPNAQLIRSGAHPDNPSLSHITSPTTRSSSLSVSQTWSVVGSEDENTMEDSEDGDGDGLGVNSPVSESLVEILSPHPTQGISRQRSVRAHDIFAASHISFSELGSLVVSSDSEPI